MSTNFPAGLDTATELGPNYINTSAVTDQQRQIDATFRTNIKDAMFAVEARIGITNSTVTSSLSWATLSVSGTDNQGLRFAGGGSATWPGLVGEDGVFLDSGTGFPAFHRNGDAAGVFYPLTTAGSNLQSAYNAGATITTSGTDLAFTFTTPDDFTLSMGAGSQLKISSSAGNTLTTGMVDIDHVAGATGSVAFASNTQNSVDGRTFTGVESTIDNGGNLPVAASQINAFSAQIDMTGDGTGSDPSYGVAYFADTPTFTGAGSYQSIGLSIATGYDFGIASLTNSNLFFAATGTQTTTFNANHTPTGFTSGEGVVFVKAKLGLTNTPMLNLETALKSGDLLGGRSLSVYSTTNTSDSEAMAASGEMNSVYIRNNTDATDNTTSEHYGVNLALQYYNSVGTNDGGGISYGVRINAPEALDGGGNYHNNDGTFPARWALYVDEGEARLRRTLFTGPSNLAKALVYYDQNDADEPFVALDGSYNGTPANGNVTDNIGTGSVVGPLNSLWTCVGLYRVEVVSGGGSLPAGDYFVPLYSL